MPVRFPFLIACKLNQREVDGCRRLMRWSVATVAGAGGRESALDDPGDRRTGDRRRQAAASGDGNAERLARFLGADVTVAFADPDVTEIYCNPQDGRVRFDTRSRGKVESGLALSPDRVTMFLNAVASHQGVRLDATNPRIQAELPIAVFDGARLQGFVPPVAAGPCFNVRKPPTVVYPLDDYVARGLLLPPWRATIREAVLAHHNILIVGGTNTGKSTFANAVIHEMAECCPGERVVILEDTVELQCAAVDHLALRAGPELPLQELVKSTLRASPNRIVVGEVRDASALDLLDAWATGHPGGCATLHANSPTGALERLDRLAQRANVPPQRHLVAEAIHLVVVLRTDGRQRRVAELMRVAGLTPDGRYALSRCTEDGRWTPD